MAGFGGNLADELHRVPMWGWAALAAGGVGVFFYVRGKGGASTTAATAADTAALGGVYASDGGTSGGAVSGGSTSGGTSTSGDLNGTPVSPSQHPTPGPSTPPAPKNTVYTVQPGDVLWSIGSRYGKSAQDIYSANSSVIESTARQHGFANSDGGHWIFPGEQLVIPA